MSADVIPFPGTGPEQRAEQPMPTASAHPSIQSLVRVDMDVREQVGTARYGTPLRGFNGRDMLRDAYEEALDLATYLRGAIYERDNAPEPQSPLAPADCGAVRPNGLAVSVHDSVYTCAEKAPHSRHRSATGLTWAV